MNDNLLIEKTSSLVHEERELLIQVLSHFREIERRRLYLGYKSLFDLAVRKFGYSEDAAYRRIAAMRMLKDLPEVEEKISSGQISLTHVGLAHSLFRKEKMSQEQKIDLIEQISNASTRDAEKIIFAINPKLAKPDQVHAISETCVEIKFTADKRVQEKLEKLKGLLAHKHHGISLGELIDKLCDLGLDTLSPAAPRKRCVTNSQAETRREVWRKAQSKCEICSSIFALELDHRIPKAKGGSSHKENLRLLCRSCNQRAAIQEFGQLKMDLHLN